MVNKSKILSDLSKIAVDAMSTFSSLKKEIETPDIYLREQVFRKGMEFPDCFSCYKDGASHYKQI